MSATTTKANLAQSWGIITASYWRSTAIFAPTPRRSAPIRRAPSVPIRQCLETGILTPDRTHFDYGCGYGFDVDYLQEQGIRSTGYDPYHRPQRKQSADVVTLLFVLNVIRDPIEREAVLVEAYHLAQEQLVVAISWGEPHSHWRVDGDGYRTQWNTFCKFYDAAEIQTFLCAILGLFPTPLLGATGAYLFAKDDRVDTLQPHALTRTQRRQLLKRYQDERTHLLASGWVPSEQVRWDSILAKGYRYPRLRSPLPDIPNPSTGKLNKSLHAGAVGSPRRQWIEAALARRDQMRIIAARIEYLSAIQ
ncbi:methyltransferase domain-containing protein [Laspinema palackyanum]|uniref:methyltransferase domain-containing protein n=1 Tax=Laspinema palackyanum TaxID=3231601 RepID=UPI00345D770E|nr:hypothetical protein [Laspinema sp. D2c]